MRYSKEILERLHAELLDILAEIQRVCERLDIPFFIQGGTAIGAFFYGDIIPWDDDIDIGMTRENYERFLREAPGELRDGYHLQHFTTEPATPFYFAKIRKDGTSFIAYDEEGLPIHHGIYVDLFPYDNIPDSPGAERRHRALAGFWINCFLGKSNWLWRWFGHRADGRYLPKSFVSCLALKVVCTLLSKRCIYRIMTRTMCRWNSRTCRYVNIVRMPRDQIAAEAVRNTVPMRLGPLVVPAPDDLETYLRHHYPRLRRNIPESEQVNHAPEVLSFDASGENCLLP